MLRNKIQKNETTGNGCTGPHANNKVKIVVNKNNTNLQQKAKY